MEWTKEDSEKAIADGWDIFSIDGRDEEFQLQRDDESEKFSNDMEVWRHVATLARDEDPHARKALDFLRQHSPDEYDAIMEWCQ